MIPFYIVVEVIKRVLVALPAHYHVEHYDTVRAQHVLYLSDELLEVKHMIDGVRELKVKGSNHVRGGGKKAF